MSDLRWHSFQPHHIPEYLSFAYDSYRKDGQVSDTRQVFNLKNENIIHGLIKAAAYLNELNQSSVVFNSYLSFEGKMVSATFHCDINYFHDKVAEEIGMSQAYIVPRQAIVKGKKGLFGMRHCVRPDFSNSKVYSYHFWLNSVHFQSKGYELGYSVVLNPYSLKLVERQGGQIIDSREVIINGKKTIKYSVIVESAKGATMLKNISPRL